MRVESPYYTLGTGYYTLPEAKVDILTVISLALQAAPNLAALFLPAVADNPDVPEEVKAAARQHLAELDGEIERMKRLAGVTGVSTIAPKPEGDQ